MAAVSAVEHKAVLAAAHQVVRLGGEEVILPVLPSGLLDMDALDAALARRPSVVSVMWVNNETGVVQPMAEVADRCCDAKVLLHTDAVQAFGKIPVTFIGFECTLASLSGHKIGAPKGIGALIVRDRHAVEAMIHGGGQQFGIRPGTENVAGAVAHGPGRPPWPCAELEAHTAHLRAAAHRADRAPARRHSRPCGPLPRTRRAPRTWSSCAVPGADSEALLMHLDLAGVCCVRWLGLLHRRARAEPRADRDGSASGACRWAPCDSSLGHETTEAEIARVAEVFPVVVAKVRRLAVVLGRA